MPKVDVGSGASVEYQPGGRNGLFAHRTADGELCVSHVVVARERPLEVPTFCCGCNRYGGYVKNGVWTKMRKPSNAATYRKAAFDLAIAEKARVIVEVGVYAGDLSKMLATVPTLETLLIVDSWLSSYGGFGKAQMEAVAESVIAWAATQPKVRVHRADSAEAAKSVANGSVDFWQTDGDHTLNGIRADIRAWLPKVRLGGVLCGDNFEIPTVAQGVREAFGEPRLLANGRLWWVRKL